MTNYSSLCGLGQLKEFLYENICTSCLKSSASKWTQVKMIHCIVKGTVILDYCSCPRNCGYLKKYGFDRIDGAVMWYQNTTPYSR